MSENKLVKKHKELAKPVNILVKRDPVKNPLTYPEWRKLIINGLRDKTVCLYLPDILFNYNILWKLQVPKKIINRLLRKGILYKEATSKATFLRLKE